MSAVCRSTINQAVTPDAMRGRMSSVFGLVVTGGPRLGDIESGTVAGVAGVRPSIVSGGLACLVGVALIAVLCPSLVRFDTEDWLAAAPAGLERTSTWFAYARFPPPGETAISSNRSMIRRVNSERAVALSGSRALLMQAAHPLAVVGLLAHSDSLDAPYERLARTAQVMNTITFGSREDADRVTAMVRKMHRRVRGRLADGGRDLPGRHPLSRPTTPSC